MGLDFKKILKIVDTSSPRQAHKTKALKKPLRDEDLIDKAGRGLKTLERFRFDRSKRKQVELKTSMLQEKLNRERARTRRERRESKADLFFGRRR